MAEAPNLTLAVTSELGSYIQELEDGTVDFAVEREEDLPADFEGTPLGGFALACWMRRGHPLADDELTVEKMLRYKWVHYYMLNTESISSRSATLFDQWIGRQGYTREKMLVTTQLMTALDTLFNTDCLMIGSLQDLEVEGEFYEIVRNPCGKPAGGTVLPPQHRQPPPHRHLSGFTAGSLIRPFRWWRR